MRRFVMMLGLLSLAACEGPVGPEGPQGAIGPQGPQGPPPQKNVYVVRANSLGQASQVLPANVGGTDPNRPPAIVCLTSDAPSGSPWLLVAHDDVSATCGLSFGTNTWIALMIGTAANWYAMFIVIS